MGSRVRRSSQGRAQADAGNCGSDLRSRQVAMKPGPDPETAPLPPVGASRRKTRQPDDEQSHSLTRRQRYPGEHPRVTGPRAGNQAPGPGEMPDRAMRSRLKKYARGMGYADLQDGWPPRSRADAEPTDGPVPAETPGEEAPGYRPPPVSAADEAAWRGTDRSADEAAWRGTDEANWRGNGATDRPAYAAPGDGGPGSGG